MFPRLSKIEYVILDILRGGDGRYGLEMVRESNGRLKRGTIYVTLNRMVEKGYLSSTAEKVVSQAGLPRRKYRVCGDGQRALRAADAALVAYGEAHV